MRRTFTLGDGLVQEQAEHAAGDSAEEVEAHEGGVPDEMYDRWSHEVEGEAVEEDVADIAMREGRGDYRPSVLQRQ